MDLIELLPACEGHPLFILKWILEVLVYGITHCEFAHLSGPTRQRQELSARSALSGA